MVCMVLHLYTPLHCKLPSTLALYIPTSKYSSNESTSMQNKNKTITLVYA